MAGDGDTGLPYQDSSYSCLVLLAAGGLELLYASGVGTIGVLIVHISETFNVPTSELTWVGGLLLFSGFILGFIPSWLARRYGVRPVGMAASILGCVSFVISSFAPSVKLLYFSHGILASIALCTFFNLAAISGQQYFHRRRSMASGFTMASISAGLLIWPTSCQVLLDEYGWRGTFLLMGAIQLHGLVFSALIRPVPTCSINTDLNNGNQNNEITLDEVKGEDIGANGVIEEATTQQTAEVHGKTEVEVKSPSEHSSRGIRGLGILAMLKTSCSPVTSTPRYLCYLIGIFLIQTGHITAISMLPLHANKLHMSRTQGAILVSTLGGLGGIGRAAFGLVGDWSRLNRTLVVGLSGFVSGLLTCGMGYLTTYSQLLGVTALLGITSAGYNALQGACVIDQVGRDLLAPGVGLLSVSMGFGRLTAMLISGVVIAVFDPRYVFVMFGLVEAVGGLFMPLVVLLKRRAEYRNKVPRATSCSS